MDESYPAAGPARARAPEAVPQAQQASAVDPGQAADAC